MATFKPYSEKIAGPFNALMEPHRKLHATAERIIAEYKAGRKDKAHAIYTEETIPAVVSVQENLHKIKEILREDEETAYKKLEAAQHRAYIVTAVLTTVIILFSIFGGLIFVKGLTKPIKKLLAAIQSIAQGNLTEKVDHVKSADETGMVLAALNNMVDKMREVVAHVKSASDNVASGSQQLSAGSEQLSQGTTEQAASAEEASSSVEEMNATIKQNADNAQQTEKIALKSATDAMESGKAVSETVGAMKDIAALEVALIGDVKVSLRDFRKIIAEAERQGIVPTPDLGVIEEREGGKSYSSRIHVPIGIELDESEIPSIVDSVRAAAMSLTPRRAWYGTIALSARGSISLLGAVSPVGSGGIKQLPSDDLAKRGIQAEGYNSTGAHRTLESMLSRLWTVLEELSQEDAVILIRYVTVTTFDRKSPEEQAEWRQEQEG
jgi:X-X-X-Leu-X-X-Gly heptad repeat protein